MGFGLKIRAEQLRFVDCEWPETGLLSVDHYDYLTRRPFVQLWRPPLRAAATSVPFLQRRRRPFHRLRPAVTLSTDFSSCPRAGLTVVSVACLKMGFA
jgi:hypothetical protein